MGKTFLTWGENSNTWSSTDFTWIDVAVTTAVINGSGGSEMGGYGWDKQQKHPWDRIKKQVPQETADHFLKLVCRVNGIEYSVEKEKSIARNITIRDIQKTFDAVVPGKTKITIKLKK